MDSAHEVKSRCQHVIRAGKGLVDNEFVTHNNWYFCYFRCKSIGILCEKAA